MSYSLFVEKSATLTSASDSNIEIITKASLSDLIQALLSACKRVKYNALHYAQVIDNNTSSAVYSFDVTHNNTLNVIRDIQHKQLNRSYN